jgi:tetratricopeptide (TPR) repeat protein
MSHLLAVPLLLAFGLAGAGTRAGESDPIGRLNTLGVTLALSGRAAEAESVFVSMLSRASGDARALNNLGNLHLWRGEPDVALAFYLEASDADTADAAIPLNQALAWLAEGEEDLAQQQAEQGVRRVGGIASAARLLGIRSADLELGSDRGADPARLSRERALLLLRSAARAVPVDSTSHPPAVADTAHAGRSTPTWRSAGARGSDSSDPRVMVYWKY